MSLLFSLASASDVITQSAAQACKSGCGNADIGAIFGQITNALLFIIGAVAVIMIIVGGLRYVTSDGDAKRVESAKNTIMYSIMGVVASIAAYAIVTFVVKNIGK